MEPLTEHKIKFEHLHLHVKRYGDQSDRRDLLLLHGFLGAGRQFSHLFPTLAERVNPVTVDISLLYQDSYDNHHQPSTPVQNREPSVIRFDAESLVNGVQNIITNYLSSQPLLLGYSMGGRLALCWAVKYSDYASGLILESATPGLTDPVERQKRRNADAIQAEKIRSNYHAFLDEWENKPLFSGKKRPLHQLEELQRKADPEIMARWLIDFGTGSMPSLWDKLSRITCPVLLITGAFDSKFCKLAKQMVNYIPAGRHVIIPDAAHRVHIDNPEDYLSKLIPFFTDIE